MIRRRLAIYGPARLSDPELLSLLLSGQGHRRVELADRVLGAAGSLDRLSRLGAAELGALGLGPVETARMGAALEIGRRARFKPLTITRLCEPRDAYRFVAPELMGGERECFVAVVLDVQNRPRRIVRVCEGSVDSCSVDPREVFVHAVRERGSAVLLAHNHPSGDPTPSREDITLTERLCQAGQLLGMPVIDHIIVGAEGSYASLAESGHLRRRAA